MRAVYAEVCESLYGYVLFAVTTLLNVAANVACVTAGFAMVAVVVTHAVCAASVDAGVLTLAVPGPVRVAWACPVRRNATQRGCGVRASALQSADL